MMAWRSRLGLAGFFGAILFASHSFAQPANKSSNPILQYIDPIVEDEFNADVTDANRATRTPKRGGVLRLRTPADYSDLNVITSNGQPERQVESLITDSLVSQDLETLEFFPKMAWTFATADLIKLKNGEIQEGTLVEAGDEHDPASAVTFVPNAWRHTFNKFDVASAGDGSLTLKPEHGGATYRGRVTELIYTYQVDESADPERAASAIKTTIGELDTWNDDVNGTPMARPFRKRECAYKLRIRKGMEWDDGKPFSAEDVKFSFETIQNVHVNAQHIRNYYQHIDTCRIEPDGETVYFRNNKPYFDQFSVIGGLYLVPRHVFSPEQYGGDAEAFAKAFNEHVFRQQPVGIGPYRIKGRKPGESLTVVRNDGYWASKLPDGAVPHWHPEQPYFDEIRFSIVMDKTATLKELQKGNLDADLDVEPDTWYFAETQTEDFKNRFTRAKHYGFLYTYIGFNMERAIFKDAETRRAISMLIPRERIAKDIHQGLAEEVTGPFYSRGPGYDKNVPQIEYDLEGAKKLLRSNGWLDRDGDGVIEKEIDGKTVPLAFEYSIHNAREYHQKIADIIKESVEQAGIRMTIKKTDWTVFSDSIRDKNFDTVRFAWGTGLDPDPYQIWHSSQIENKGDNFLSYRNKRVDEICDAIREEFDPPKRWELAREMHGIVAKDQPCIFLFGFYETYFIARGIQGVKFYPSANTPYDWTEWWWANESAKPNPATAPTATGGGGMLKVATIVIGVIGLMFMMYLLLKPKR